MTRTPGGTAASLLALLLATILCACAATPGPQARTLEHVVVVWLKEPGNPAHRQAIIAQSETLRGIPGVLALKSGSVIPSDRSIVDSSFDVALVISFASQADLDAYLVHPLHVRLVNETLKPLVAKIRVYDFQ